MTNASISITSNTTQKNERFSFNGTGVQYYLIYIVNVLLSLITFGIYSAWAKVRNKRYFNGHTNLFNRAFDFDARPIGILIARIIIVGLFILLYFLDESFTLKVREVGILSTLIILLFPVLIVRGRAFNARHTIYCGVRFRYQLRYGPSYTLLFLGVIPGFLLAFLGNEIFLAHNNLIARPPQEITVLYYLAGTIFIFAIITAPLFLYLSHKVKINQLSFGDLNFKLGTSLSDYVRPYLVTVLISILLCMPIISKAYFAEEFNKELFDMAANILLVVIPLVLVYIGYLCFMTKLYLSAIRLSDGARLRCHLNLWVYMFWIIILNWILLLLTLGLFLPLARVRKWRALTNSLEYVPPPGATATTVEARLSDYLHAHGEEAGDFAGFDVDFGVI